MTKKWSEEDLASTTEEVVGAEVEETFELLEDEELEEEVLELELEDEGEVAAGVSLDPKLAS